ncbi:hypothetical protein HZH66_012902 [Vespula vulgaris]|uniref:Uncharacterized protein n=1 Tax=Vespula vulgaris TaxID=7454 RepID=A0A834MSC9_VESVU|nr:hypothetical protein HZH66_012902 [Vespula vulgaris]
MSIGMLPHHSRITCVRSENICLISFLLMGNTSRKYSISFCRVTSLPYVLALLQISLSLCDTKILVLIHRKQLRSEPIGNGTEKGFALSIADPFFRVIVSVTIFTIPIAFTILISAFDDILLWNPNYDPGELVEGEPIAISTLNIFVICYNIEKCYIQNFYGMKGDIVVIVDYE